MTRPRSVPWLAAIFFPILAASMAGATEQPAQPTSEETIASAFEAAAPQLLEEWISRRPAELEGMQKGSRGIVSHCGEKNYWFEFLSCKDTAKPILVGLDVKKTDSLISPFLGVLTVHTTESCDLK